MENNIKIFKGFDFTKFIENCRKTPDKADSIKKYEAIFNLSSDIRSNYFYTNYLASFNPVKFKVILELEDYFDWDLFSQLVACSFSSDYKFISDDNYSTFDLQISIESESEEIKKNISDLWAFQIEGMFEIYILEQINHSVLAYESNDEKASIDIEYNKHLNLWNNTLNDLGYI